MADILSSAIDTTFDTLGQMPLARKLEGALGGRGAVTDYVEQEVAELGPALSRGFGAFGARIAGGEQGFIAYMNNLAKQEAAEDQRSHENKLHDRAESFRREMLELEHGYKLDAQGRDVKARKNLQTQIDAAALERAKLAETGTQRRADDRIASTEDVAWADRDSREEIARLDRDANLALRKADKLADKENTGDQIRNLFHRRVVSDSNFKNALIRWVAKASTPAITVDAATVLFENDPVSLVNRYASEYIRTSDVQGANANIQRTQQVIDAAPQTRAFLEQWAGHPDLKGVDLNSPSQSPETQGMLADKIRSSPEYKLVQPNGVLESLNSNLNSVANNPKAYDRAGWEGQNSRLINLTKQFSEIVQRNSWLDESEASRDVMTRIRTTMLDKDIIIETGLGSALLKDTQSFGPDTTSPQNPVNQMYPILQQMPTETEWKDTWWATTNKEPFMATWNRIQNLLPGEITQMGRHADARIIEMHQLLKDEQLGFDEESGGLSPDTLLSTLREEYSGHEKTLEGGFPFKPPPWYEKAQALWRDMSESKYNTLAIDRAIKFGKGEDKMVKARSQLKTQADIFVSTLFKNILPTGVEDQGALTQGIWTEEELDNFLFSGARPAFKQDPITGDPISDGSIMERFGQATADKFGDLLTGGMSAIPGADAKLTLDLKIDNINKALQGPLNPMLKTFLEAVIEPLEKQRRNYNSVNGRAINVPPQPASKTVDAATAVKHNAVEQILKFADPVQLKNSAAAMFTEFSDAISTLSPALQAKLGTPEKFNPYGPWQGKERGEDRFVSAGWKDYEESTETSHYRKTGHWDISGMKYIGGLLEIGDFIKDVDLSVLKGAGPGAEKALEILSPIQDFIKTEPEQSWIGNYGESFRTPPSKQSFFDSMKSQRLSLTRGKEARSIERASGGPGETGFWPRALGYGFFDGNVPYTQEYPSMQRQLEEEIPAIDLSSYMGIKSGYDAGVIRDVMYSHVTTEAQLDTFKSDNKDLANLIANVKAGMAAYNQGQGDMPKMGVGKDDYGRYAVSPEMLNELNQKGIFANMWDSRDIDIVVKKLAKNLELEKEMAHEAEYKPLFDLNVADVLWLDVLSEGSVSLEDEEAKFGSQTNTISVQTLADNAAHRVEQLSDQTMVANMTDKAGIERQRNAILSSGHGLASESHLEAAVFTALEQGIQSYHDSEVGKDLTASGRRAAQMKFAENYKDRLKEVVTQLQTHHKFKGMTREMFRGPLAAWLPKDFDERSLSDRSVLTVGAVLMAGRHGRVAEEAKRPGIEPHGFWGEPGVGYYR